jgi:hypothetical protein
MPLNDLLAVEPERAAVLDPAPAWYLLAFLQIMSIKDPLD